MNYQPPSRIERLLRYKDRNLLVVFLSGIYGVGSWIAMTGLWVELPLLVQRLPERWTLASRLTLVLQIANIGPIVYGLLNKRYPKIVSERSGTHGQLAIGAVSTFLLIFFWSSSVDIAGSKHSIALYVLSFGLSIVDCTSSVVFLPYMAFFKSMYLVPYLVGEGLSGLLPSLVAMGQGIDKEICVNESTTVPSEDGLSNITKFQMVSIVGNPTFEPEWFFTFLLAMLLCSWAAFCMLDKLKICKREMVPNSTTEEMFDSEEVVELRKRKREEFDEKEEENFLPKDNDASQVQVDFCANKGPPKKRFSSKRSYFYFLFLQCWASVATFGVFPAIQPYSCLPYGDEPFHYAVTLCGLAYPVACLAAMFCEVRDVVMISTLTAAGTMISVFLMFTAIMSPSPPLVGTATGSYLVVICWVAFILLLSYVKTMVTVLLGECWSQKGLFWCGAVTQAGAAVGALLMFLLINVFELFHDDGMCI